MKPKPFKKLTAAQKRVAIAKDVIKQIRSRQYNIETGSYFEWEFSLEPQLKISKKSLSEKRRCDVCAVGAAIASGLRLFNGSRYEEITKWNAFHAARKWFTANQAIAIECAFETSASQWLATNFKGNKQLNIRARRFAASHGGTASNRALCIFRNIIRNKGEFVP